MSVQFIDGPVRGLKVKDILPSRTRWATMQAKDTIAEALKTLGKDRILSVPVYSGQTFVGSVDVWDLVMVLVARCSTDNKTVSDPIEVQKYLTQNLQYVLDVARSWKKNENPYVDTDISLMPHEDLAKMVNLFWGGYHRVPVSLGGDRWTYVSQSDLVRFMTINMPLVLGVDIMKNNLVQNGYVFNPSKVVTCRTTDSAYHCFVRCVQESIMAVAIVDASGSLVTTLSCSDLRFLGFTDLADLSLPVVEFLEKHSWQTREYNFPKDVRGLLQWNLPHTCKATDAFELVMYKVAALRVHRLWVVDDNNKPIGVVTLSDLMKTFLIGRPM